MQNRTKSNQVVFKLQCFFLRKSQRTTWIIGLFTQNQQVIRVISTKASTLSNSETKHEKTLWRYLTDHHFVSIMSGYQANQEDEERTKTNY